MDKVMHCTLLAAGELRYLLAPEACENGEISLASKMHEPGYEDETVYAVGNWNDHETLGNALEGIGIDLLWSDEWIECDDCGGLVRTQPDSYHWHPSYRITSDSEVVCHHCSPEPMWPKVEVVADLLRAVQPCVIDDEGEQERVEVQLWEGSHYPSGWKIDTTCVSTSVLSARDDDIAITAIATVLIEEARKEWRAQFQSV